MPAAAPAPEPTARGVTNSPKNRQAPDPRIDALADLCDETEPLRVVLPPAEHFLNLDEANGDTTLLSIHRMPVLVMRVASRPTFAPARSSDA
jgi:hypothetical protein